MEEFELFKKQYPFDLLSEEEFDAIFGKAVVKEYSKNEFLIHEDQADDTIDIHFLISGLAKNIMHRSNGRQLSVRFYYPGDLIGVMILLTSGEMRFSVQALEPIKTLCFERESFLEIMSNNTQFSKVVMDGISHLMKSLYDEVKYKSSTTDEQDDRELYKKRADAYMETPTFIHPDESIEQAARLLQQQKIEALIVSEDQKTMLGMIGYGEILRAYFENDHRNPVRAYMSEEAYEINEQEFIYDALSYLKHHPTEIIPVLHKDKIVGILRQSSFFTIKNSVYFDLTYRISNATTANEIKQLSPIHNERFQQFVASLINDHMFAYDIAELITNYNDRIHKQIVQIAEDEMIAEGYGAPPVNYCFLVMGSEGRKEQAFSTDQDNGMILSDYELSKNKQQIESYFVIFAEKINAMLDDCGFPYCKGGIMAKEDKWRKQMTDWHQTIDQWINQMDAEEIRDFTIFMDFRPIFGDYSLAYDLKKYVTKRVQKSLNLHQLLMKDTLRFRVPVQPFGRISGVGKKRTLNLKKSAIMQIVNAIRIYSMKHGIEEINTVNRLDALAEQERFHPRDVENAKTALHRLMMFRLKENLNQLKENETLSNDLRLGQLKKDERRSLREALIIAKRLQQVLELSYNRNRVV
ncbi:cyclic nucleotide-binding domain-containing protein [Halobacillus locisalis]|uniref:Cyclic nucleotide-binding domain-containing protein n=1 Tax=Halobacillus locisalis TaxID=220753 RepID=A0A838CNM6_9BACI|nr:cyclic nucleotide-binding domain-containing protein [Halobacillus locisalis]